MQLQGLAAPCRQWKASSDFHTLYGEGDVETLTRDVGALYESMATAIKKYPSCTANHVPIDLLIDVAEYNDLAPGDIDRVEIELSPFANGLVGDAFDPSENPQVAAQFSIHYSAASALLRRRLGIAEIQDDAVHDAAIANFISKVDIKIDDGNSGKFAPARVTVKTSSGATLGGQLENVPGTPANPLSDDQVAAKFRDCAQFGLQPRSTAESRFFGRDPSASWKHRNTLTGILERS